MNLSTINSTRIAKFGAGGAILRSASPLDDEQIRTAAPSVFAMQKHESRSDRFTYIPTSDVLQGLRREGFMPFEVRQGGSRDEEKRSFTKHMIRLRKEGDRAVGDSVRELILLNAHDGTSSYRLLSGVFRMVCSNGLVIADGYAQELRIAHKGDVVSQVIEGAFQVIDEGQRIDAQLDNFRALELAPAEQEAFANAALQLRYDADSVPDIQPRQLNLPRREADRGGDMWRTFNRVQENLVRGGVSYTARTEDEQGRPRITRRTSRPVNGIDGNVNLNRALWTLASEMGKLKAAA